MKPDILINMKTIEKLDAPSKTLSRWKQQYSNFNGDILKFLKSTNINVEDKIAIALHCLPEHIVEVFAFDCAFSAVHDDTTVLSAAATAFGPFDIAGCAVCTATNAANAIAFKVAANSNDYRTFYRIARDAERENQVDALIMLISLERGAH
jgi:hypothetical protein